MYYYYYVGIVRTPTVCISLYFYIFFSINIIWRSKPISELIWYTRMQTPIVVMQTSVKRFFAARRWREILCQHMAKNTVFECVWVCVCVCMCMCVVLLWRVQNWIPPMTLFPLESRTNSARQIDFLRCRCSRSCQPGDYDGGYTMYLYI